MESIFMKVAVILSMTMGISALGAYCGRKIESRWALISLALLFIAGSIGVFIAAHVSPLIGVSSLAAWAFVSGLFLGPSLQHFAKVLGWRTVAGAFGGTAGSMAICASIGLFSGVDFSGMGLYLGFALIGLIIVSLVAMFVLMSREVNILYSIAGMLVFSAYFIFDFFRLGHSENTWEKAIDLTLNIYLDFINFFWKLLMFLEAVHEKH